MATTGSFVVLIIVLCMVSTRFSVGLLLFVGIYVGSGVLNEGLESEGFSSGYTVVSAVWLCPGVVFNIFE